MIYESPKIITGRLSPGDIIKMGDTSNNFLVVQGTAVLVNPSAEHQLESQLLPINLNADPVNIDAITLTIRYSHKSRHDIWGKLFLWPDGKLHHTTMDDSHNYGSSPQTHDSVLPTDNPLASIPYWGHPGGKNLTIIHALEWALLHTQTENGKLPCKENEITIQALQEALKAQRLRQELRIKQGVLGTMLPHI